ncbi:MAG TPA: orotate phosphoribosyltransferase [Actinomycetota bacterium]|nr:orotate phosphoribosyltransferase [Actinomycetota bacterium]
MNPHEVLDVMERHGAIQRGHFRLSSGRHSDVYVQKFRVLEHPPLTASLGAALADQFESRFACVASPAVGAVVLGFSVALAAAARSIFAERVDGRLELRRGFAVKPREEVLVVEDVVTTGGSARELLDLVRGVGATVVGVGALLDRTTAGAPPDFGAPFRALARLDADSWDPDRCPACAAGEPLDDPGSRRLPR